jgi:hypothetical protein
VTQAQLAQLAQLEVTEQTVLQVQMEAMARQE